VSPRLGAEIIAVLCSDGCWRQPPPTRSQENGDEGRTEVAQVQQPKTSPKATRDSPRRKPHKPPILHTLTKEQKVLLEQHMDAG
jgi:hypothetical protein